jgi:phosphoribosylanthranilate isomerase
VKTAIKICGIRDPETAKAAVIHGAKYIGIMCYSASKRYVDPAMGRQISEAVKRAGGIPVAVFVDHDAEAMRSLCQLMAVNTVQLHGPLSRQSHAQLPVDFHRIYVLTVDKNGRIEMNEEYDLTDLDADRDMIMYDGQQSGSGVAYDLSEFTNPHPLPFMLAGGLTVDNVAYTIRTVHPNAVDVSSGVESSMGIKSEALITAFIDAVEEVDHE